MPPDSNERPRERSRIVGSLRRLLALVVWLALSVGALLLSAWVHLDTPQAREVGRVVANEQVSALMTGTLEIGRLEVLTPWRVEAAEVTLYDPRGRPVITGERVILVPDLSAALAGNLRFSHSELHGGTLTLIENEEGNPSFLDAFASPEPSTGEPGGMDAFVEDMHLDGITVTGTLLGIEGIRVEDAHAHMRLEVDGDVEHGFLLHVFDAGGRWVAPYPYAVDLERVYAEVRDDPDAGTMLWARVASDRDDHARVLLHYTTPDERDHLDLQAQLEPVHAERLAESGMEWAEAFSGPLRGHVRFHGDPEDLALEADLVAPAGDLAVRGRLPSTGTTEVTIETGALRLDRLRPELPEAEVRGTVTLRVPEGEGDTEVVVDVEPFTLEGYTVPGGHVEGRLDAEGFTVDEARAAYPGANVEVRGRVRNSGAIELHLIGRVAQIADDPNLAPLVPGVRAGLRFDMRLTLDEELDARGRWVFTNVRAGSLTATRLVAEGRVHGDLDAPRVALDVEASEVAAEGIPIGEGTGRVVGGPTNYHVELALQRGARRIEASAEVALRGSAIEAEVTPLLLADGQRTWRGALRGLRYRGGRLFVGDFEEDTGGLRLVAGERRIDAQLRYGMNRGRDDDGIHLEVEAVEIDALRPWLGARIPPGLRGTLTAEASVEGGLADPRVVLDGQLVRGAYGPARSLDAAWLVTYFEGRLDGDAEIEAGERGQVDVHVEGLLDTSLPVAESLEYGAYELKLETEGIEVALLTDLVGEDVAAEWPTLEGRARGAVVFNGALDFFDFRGRLRVPSLVVGEWPPLGVGSTFSFQDGVLAARVTTSDGAGDLAEVEGSISLDLMSLVADPSLLTAIFEVAPWRLAARFPARNLGTLPEPIRDYVPEADSLRASATMTVAGGAFETHADLLGQVEWLGDIEGASCGVSARPRLRVDARLQNGRTLGRVDGLVGGARVMVAEVDAPTPVDLWLQEPELAAIPPTRIAATVEHAPLDQVPLACDLFGGDVTMHVLAEKVFTDRPWAEVTVHGDAIYGRRLERVLGEERAIREVERTPPFQVSVQGRAAERLLAADTVMRWWNGGTTRVESDVPLGFDEELALPTVDLEAPVHASAMLHAMPLEATLFWLDTLGQIDGDLTGDVDLMGSLSEPELSGSLDLRDGEMDIRSLGQRLRDVSGGFIFEGDRITLQGLRARDGDGVTSIAGDVTLEQLVPRQLALRLVAEKFPVRNEGSVMAELTGSSRIDLRLEDDAMRGEVTVESLGVFLPEGLGRTPQSLALHPDIRVVGREGETVVGDPFVVDLHVDGRQPFTVSSAEFGATVTADLDVVYREPDLSVGGTVEILDGFLDLYGKQFAVSEGTMRFDPTDSELNPVVNLVAVHNLRSSPGDQVVVRATGTLADPQVSFTSTITDDEATIVALLVSGQVRQGTLDEVSQQTRNFLIGVASGVLTLSLREEFGYYFPSVVLRGNEYGGTRIGAGYSFDDLLPSWLRSVVTNIYVEGYLNTAGEDTSATQGQVQDYGFLLELSLPRSVVTGVNYQPPSSAAIDVTWQP